MRKELKIIGSRDRHVFTATFIRFGFRDGYKGPVKTILLQDVLLDGNIIKSICKISEQVKSFISPEQIKAIAESNEPILLLSNN